MTIEVHLERIAVALEEIRKTLQQTVNPVVQVSQPAAPPATPSMHEQLTPAASPVNPPMPAPGPSPVPVVSPPSAPVQAAPVQAVPTLDDIRALANDFHRAHPERAAEVVNILAGVNAKKLSEIPPDSYPAVHEQLKRLAGV